MWFEKFWARVSSAVQGRKTEEKRRTAGGTRERDIHLNTVAAGVAAHNPGAIGIGIVGIVKH